jgi:hypothetical protein
MMIKCWHHDVTKGIAMRTTLSLDDDVAIKLKRLSKNRSFKSVVNEALRAGLHALETEKKESEVYRTEPVRGNPRIKNLDSIADVIADVEAEDSR